MSHRSLAGLTALALVGSVAAQSTPALMQFQFNEVRGTTAANTASGNLVPATGLYNMAGWQSDPGRPGFRGNEAGFGCLGYRGVASGWINTGWRISQTGSMTIMFWLRRDLASTSTNPFGYAFGDVSFRAFAAGAAGQGITFRGSAIGNVDSVFPVTGTPGVWQHVTLVVDDAAGQALWYDNGIPSSNVISFPVGTFAYNQAGTRTMAVGAQGDSGLSTIGLHYDMDDFRYYNRALIQAEILAVMAAENPSAGVFASGCAGPTGVPTIAGIGLPQVGTSSFAISLGNAETGRLTGLILGLAPAAFGTFDLSGVLGTGCALQVDWFASTFHVVVAGTASQALPIANNPALSGFHVYGQWLVAGTTGAASPALDVSIK